MKKQAIAILFAGLILGLSACGSVGDGAKATGSATEQAKGEDTGDGAELSSSTEKGDSNKAEGQTSDQDSSDLNTGGNGGDSIETDEADVQVADSEGKKDAQAVDPEADAQVADSVEEKDVQAIDPEDADLSDDGSGSSGGKTNSGEEGAGADEDAQDLSGHDGDNSTAGISEELPSDPKSIKVTSAEDGVSLLKAIYGTSDDESGNPYTFQYLDTFTLDEGEFYGYQWSWKVDEDHFSKISDVLVKTDGSAVYQGVYNGQEWEEVYFEDNQLK